MHGWHIDAICAHLEAVSNGDVTRLLINVPPGTMKSLLVSVFWPAWEWGPFGRPDYRYMGVSHEITLSIRDSRRMRLLVESDWFQDRWPIKMASDQNAKMRFENEARGLRLSRSIGSMTGERAHRLTIDDPHSTETAESEAERETSVRIFRESATSRLTDPKSSAIIVVMQRLHEGDISGWIIENAGHQYTHLMLPMRFEEERACRSKIYPDPRTKEGELLFPDRFPAATVDADEKTMGEYATAGQNQQRPAPREGGLFKIDNIKIIKSLPPCSKWCRAWDLAGTEGAGAFTAGVLIGKITDGSGYVVADVKRRQFSAGKVQKLIKSTATADRQGILAGKINKVTGEFIVDEGSPVVFKAPDKVRLPQDPGQAGKGQKADYVKLLDGFPLRMVPVAGEGDKEARATPFSVQVEGERVFMLQGEWNDAFVNELKLFPGGKYADQVDAAADAYTELLGGAERTQAFAPVSVGKTSTFAGAARG